MLIDLSKVLSEPHRPIHELVFCNLEDIRTRMGKFPIIAKEDVVLDINYLQKRQLQIVGKTSLTLEIPCDRCLEPVAVQLKLDFTKKVDLNHSEDDDMFSDEFDESNYIDGYTLDVDKLIYNEVLIGWPTKILCSEDCKGICNVCGQNLNLGTCDCEDTSLDPRMSVIRDLFKNFKEV